jgi:hypothetical protein
VSFHFSPDTTFLYEPAVIDVLMLEASDRGYIAIDKSFNRSMANFIAQAINSNNRSVYQSFIHQAGVFLSMVSRLDRYLDCSRGATDWFSQPGRSIYAKSFSAGVGHHVTSLRYKRTQFTGSSHRHWRIPSRSTPRHNGFF